MLFVAYLIREKKKASTVCSYISAIRAVLADINVTLNEDHCLLSSLTRACKISNTEVLLRLPIQRDLLHLILKTTEFHFVSLGQMFLAKLYMSLFATAYYGLFRIGELADSPHAIKARDVHIGINKNKILFILWTSKTHDLNRHPQSIKISSVKMTMNKNTYCRSFCYMNTCKSEVIMDQTQKISSFYKTIHWYHRIASEMF